MKKADALGIIAENRWKLGRFSVKSLSIFGSVARDEATDASDIDILVEFEEGRPVGMFKFVDLRDSLEEILGCRVDLATRRALREEMREQILREAVHAA